MTFESELQKGNFVVGKCYNCNKVVWPPSDYCDICFNNVKWEKVKPEGKIIEFAKNDNEVFCVSEFDVGVRIMGTLVVNSIIPEVGSKIKIEKFNIKNGKYSFVFRLC